MAIELAPRTDAPQWEQYPSPTEYLDAVKSYIATHAPTVKFQVADGYAFYAVIEHNGDLALQHLPVIDEYRIPEAHMRGLNRADIEQLLDREERLARLFGSS